MAQGWWQWLRGWWNIGTLGGFSRLYDTISKIRARYATRNRRAQPVGPTRKGGADFRSMTKCSSIYLHMSTASPLYSCI